MSFPRPGLSRAIGLLAIAGMVVPAIGCGAKHRLGHYDFAGRTVAVTYFPAPAPELVTGRHRVTAEDPVATVVSAGSRVAVEVEGRRARARLDTAATRIDLAGRVAVRAAERSSLYLGARTVPAQDAADFLMEVDIRSLTLDTRGDQASLSVRAQVVLLDRLSGHEVWSARVRSHGPVTPSVDTGGLLPSGAVTAGTLTTVSVHEFEQRLERLADLAADWVSGELRDALTKTRRR
jgi:hypothetical protein